MTNSELLAPERHLKWARCIAREVRRSFRFQTGSQEEWDIQQVAYVALLEALKRFDPARVPAGGNVEQAFRGFASQAIRTECKRECYRLRNGGLFRTTQTPQLAPKCWLGAAPELTAPDSPDDLDAADEHNVCLAV